MQSTAERLDDGRVVQEKGIVEEVEPDLVVSTSAGRYRASRAVSCLIAPEKGDLVLVAADARGSAWVLAVLERDGTAHRLTLNGDVTLEAVGGSLHLQSEHAVDVRTKGRLGLASRLFEVRAVEGKAFLDRLSFVGSLAQIDVERVKSVVGYFDQVLDRLSQTVKRSYRFVEEMDITRAHQIDVRAETTYHVKAHNTFLSSDALMKVDAEQIHLG